MTKSLPASTHSDCSHNYDCSATLTVAYFVFCGIVHKAVRFRREDMKSTGKIEIYTIESHDPESTCTELGWIECSPGEFLRYANEYNPSSVDVRAMVAIAAASVGTYSNLHVESAQRFAAMELS